MTTVFAQNPKFDFSLTEQIQFYLMQRFPTRQNHDYRMDPNDDPIYDEYTSSGNNVTEEDRHWNFNIGTDSSFLILMAHTSLYVSHRL